MKKSFDKIDTSYYITLTVYTSLPTYVLHRFLVINWYTKYKTILPDYMTINEKKYIYLCDT